MRVRRYVRRGLSHLPRLAALVLTSLPARLLQPLLALRRRGRAPLLPKLLTPLGRELLEAAVVLAYRRLLARGQRLEVLPALAQRLALLRGQRAEALEAVTRVPALGI